MRSPVILPVGVMVKERDHFCRGTSRGLYRWLGKYLFIDREYLFEAICFCYSCMSTLPMVASL
jgi:hypothetical protein